LENASSLLKALYDTPQSPKVFASGSSSIEIHKHLKESLVGRRHLIKIYPVSFDKAMNSISTPLENYLVFGGLPKRFSQKKDAESISVIQDVLEAYILKDIKSLIKEENIRAFNHLLTLLSQNQGQQISTASPAREVGLTSKTIDKYLSVMKETFVCFPLYSYAVSLSNELKKSRKQYLYDLGIRNILIKNYSKIESRKDKGTLYETAVFLALNSALEPNEELRFWRTKNGDEVDFIFIRNLIPFPIEVKYKKVLNKTVPQGMHIFLKNYPQVKQAFMITEAKNVPLLLSPNWSAYRFLKSKPFCNI
jgi:uncharacterized protein